MGQNLPRLLGFFWRIVVVLVLSCAPPCQAGSEITSSRLVVTFQTVKDNNVTGVDLSGYKVVKQYGRRLVFDLGSPFDLETQQTLLTAKLNAVQSVEMDYLVNAGQDSLQVEDALVVTNASDPDVDGAVISPASQTPLWNLKDDEPYSIHAEGVWRVTNSTPDVVVAVIDTGMAELAKPMFLHLLDGYDFISDDGISIDWDGRDPDSTDPGDWGDMCPTPSWHGTKVASILAARHDNKFGMKGIAQNCSVLPVRVLGLCRMGYATDVTDAIVWSAGGAINGVPANPNPAKIISLSLAGQGACPNYLQSAVTQAISLGAVVVAAAGNNNQNVSGYFPANCEGVLAVAASTRDGKLAAYSNWGNLIAVSAPGGDSTNAIMTLSVDALETGLVVAYGMGTSFAVPHVAAVFTIYTSKANSRTHNFTIVQFGELGASYIKAVDCLEGLCGKGIISASIDIFVPYGSNIGGYVLETADDYVWSRTPSGGSYSIECGAQKFLCQVLVYYNGVYPNYGSSTGFFYDCCDISGSITFSSNCIGYCGGRWQTNVGWFRTIAMHSTGHVTNGANAYAGYGSGNTQAIIDQGTCPSSYYVNGIYGSSDGTLNWNYVLCRLMFKPCPAGYYSVSPASGAVQCPGGTYSNAGATACTSCPNCPGGRYWSTQCGGSTAGSCDACGSCPAGQYRSGCSGTNAGSCVNCDTCPAGQYKSGCSGTSPGTCTSCASMGCLSGWFVYGCGGNNAGYCVQCTTCDGGKYYTSQCSATTNAVCAVCPTCPEGQYRAGCSGTTSSGTCTPCAADCGDGNYRSGCGLTTAGQCYQCRTCDAGNYLKDCGGLNGGVCWPCPNCLTGNYWSVPCQGRSAGTCSPCASCTVGKYMLGCSDLSPGTCTNCPAGTYRATAGATSSAGCTACGAGTYRSAPGGSSCDACGVGTYSTTIGAISATVCTNCPAGTYRTASGASSCDACGVGTYSATTGATSACTNCPAGTYRTASGGSSCNACGAGTYSATTGASLATVCTNCPAGTYRTASGGSSCNACGAGTYSATTGASSASVCTPCGTGTYSTTTGASSATACTNCAAGTYRTATGASSSGDCTSCTAGKYSTTVGASFSNTCLNCTTIPFCFPSEILKPCTTSSDAYCATCDSQSSKPADADWVGSSSSSCSWTCNIGFFRNSSNLCQLCKAPSACQTGEYVTTCTSTVDGVCTACTNKPSLNAYYTDKSHDTGLDTCPWSCNAGYSITASYECIVSTGNTQPSTTTTAQPSTTTTAQPSITTTAQPSTTTTAQPSTTTSGQSSCSAGTYLLNGTTTCKQCPAGKYSAAEGAVGTSQCTPCKQCSAGTYSAAGNSTCTNCPAGKYSAAGNSVCTNCPAGTYSAAGNSVCTNCPVGTYSAAGNSTCTNCPAGKYSAAEGGVAVARCTPCSSCSAGTYSAAGNSVCTNCPAGTYSAAGNSVCTNCPAGTYSAAGNSVCTNCPVGTYSAAGNSTCTNCPAGKYSAAEGGVAVARCTPCSSCSAGTYSAAGNSVCTNCPAGKYSTTVGATGSAQCTSCLAGTYSTGGVSACTSCSANTYTPSIGATSCTPCTTCTAAGYYKNSCSGTSPGTCDKCTNIS